MKSKLIILSLVILPCICGCTDDACKKMTDIEFKRYCLINFDINNDGKLSKTEVESVRRINCSTAENFAGIECFKNLKSFESTSVKYVNFKHNKGLNSVRMSKIDPEGKYVGAPIEKLDLSHNANLKKIGKSAFCECTNLTSVIFPKGLTSIEESAFSGCISLTSLIFPKGLTSIGWGAFKECKSLTSVTLPRDLKEIGFWAFGRCESLISVALPEGMTTIEGGVFSNCTNLTSVILPDSVTEIEELAFSGCESLKSVILPEGITKISHRAFYCCFSLTSVTFPESLTSIDKQAFSYCVSLTSVVLPVGLKNIGEEAFSFCRNLTSVTIQATKPPIFSFPYQPFANTNFSTIVYANLSEFGNINPSAILYVPSESVGEYKNAFGRYFSKVASL